jgi:hypothetical protein
MQELTERVFERAAVQLALLDYNLDSAALAVPEQAIYPRSTNQDGSLWTSHYKWWGSGFYPGSLWYVYEYTGNVMFKNMALKYQVGLEPLKFRTDHHDIGFQLMCSYGNHFCMGCRVVEPLGHVVTFTDDASAAYDDGTDRHLVLCSGHLRFTQGIPHVSFVLFHNLLKQKTRPSGRVSIFTICPQMILSISCGRDDGELPIHDVR